MAEPVQRPHRPGGFTLLEVLVAFVIVTLVFGVAFRTYSTGISNARHAGDYTTAALWGDSKLAQLATDGPLREGTANGIFEGGYRWRLEIRKAPGTEEFSDDQAMPQLYEIALRVAWGPSGSVRSLRWRTFRLQGRTEQ